MAPSSDYTDPMINRRQFIQAGAAGTSLMAMGGLSYGASPSVHGKDKPNILFIMTDQQHINAISAAGNPHLHTPNMDRLFRSGTSFSESYCPQPVCIPCRSSIFTGRMPTETGMWMNTARVGQLEKSIPTIGEWLQAEAGYETIYAGKWHVPQSNTYDIRGFNTICSGLNHYGDISDELVSRACESYLLQRDDVRPFFMVTSLVQPHDICHWLNTNVPNETVLRYPEIADELPPLPPNFEYDRREPKHLASQRSTRMQPHVGGWEPLQWRYYLWNYYRHVEMVDAEIGRVLNALDLSGFADNTLIVFTSDHGEGMGCHQTVRKGFLYDEAAKVPLIFSFPGRVRGGTVDSSSLVSSVDLTPTFCDFAGVAPPPDMCGRSLRPLLTGEGKAQDTSYLVSNYEAGAVKSLQAQDMARMVRTKDYKYMLYFGDDTDQLFDMKNDPWETQNLSGNAKYASVIGEHRAMLREWENRLKYAPRYTAAGGNCWRDV
jgi:arylsulfatase A-like enzyme